MKKKVVEAEGKELVLQNGNGDTIIIPKNKREQALEMLRSNNHAGIDELASSLPYLEDYAEDGTLIPDNFSTTKPVVEAQTGLVEPVNPDVPEKKTESFSGIYSNEGVQKLREQYGSGQMASFADYGCLGSTCRNVEKLYPNLPSYYEELEKAGVYSGQGINTSFANLPANKQEKAKKGNTVGVDSWELPYIMEDYKLGKSLFRNDPEKYDPEFIRSYDYKSFPIGTILSSGNAKGVYVDENAKSYRGKDEPLYRHSVSVVGYAEGKDLSGNPTRDILIDENGTLKRVGDSKEAEYTWSDYSTGTKGSFYPIHAATTRTSTEKYNYDYFKSQVSPEELKQFENKEKRDKFIKEAEKLEGDLVDGKIKPGTNQYLIAMTKIKTLDKLREQNE